MYHLTSTIILTVLFEFQAEHVLNFYKIWRIYLKIDSFYDIWPLRHCDLDPRENRKNGYANAEATLAISVKFSLNHSLA